MPGSPNIPEYREMPDLSYRSRIAFRVLQRENGFSIPEDDEQFLDWLIKETGIQTYQLFIVGCDRSQAEGFVLQRVYLKFNESMEEDLSYHGNGWFRWEKNKDTLREYATMDFRDVPIAHTFIVTVVDSCNISLKETNRRSTYHLKNGAFPFAYPCVADRSTDG